MRAFDLVKAVRSLKPRRLPLPPGCYLNAWVVATILRPQFTKAFGKPL